MTQNLSPDKKRPLILCIEDEEELRRDLCDELSEAGYDVLEASGGKQALQLLATSRPDLILCDISMPEMSGYEVLKAVQEKEQDYANIPFVFLSALADSREVIEGKRQGADDYLIKPIDYDLLLITIHARLRQISRIQSQHLAMNTIDAALLSRRYSLTPTEARVAIALTEGKQLAQIAKDFAIARTTIAFHMRNIFQKTGTNRQAELVTLLLSGSKGLKR